MQKPLLSIEEGLTKKIISSNKVFHSAIHNKEENTVEWLDSVSISTDLLYEASKIQGTI
jgi:hypothetical protein